MQTNEMQFDLQRLPLDKLVNNDGQITGVPKNPRTLTEKEYKRLKRKLRDLDFTNARPLIAFPMGEQYVVFCGNQRLRALREIGKTEVACAIVPPDTTPDAIVKILLADNKSEGEWDNDILANEYNQQLVQEWAGVAEQWEEPTAESSDTAADGEDGDDGAEYIGAHEDGEMYLVELSFALKIAEYNAIKAKLNEIGGDKNTALLKLAGL